MTLFRWDASCPGITIRGVTIKPVQPSTNIGETFKYHKSSIQIWPKMYNRKIINNTICLPIHQIILQPSWSIHLLIRRYEKLYNDLVIEDLDGIYKRTGCLKPCHYMKYWIEGDRHPTSFKSENFLFGLSPVSNYTFVETELLIYPWTSLVAEFGGSLSLFLGISFMSLWDGIHVVREGLQFFKKDNEVLYQTKNQGCL